MNDFQGVALQCLGRHGEALAAFSAGLAQDPASTQLLAGLVEASIKSPLRNTLEPTFQQLQMMKLDQSPFVVISVSGIFPVRSIVRKKVSYKNYRSYKDLKLLFEAFFLQIKNKPVKLNKPFTGSRPGASCRRALPFRSNSPRICSQDWKLLPEASRKCFLSP